MYTPELTGLGRTGLELRADARALYTTGQQAYTSGRFSEALAAFRQAYQTFQNPTVLVAIGNTLERLGRLEEAAAVYRDYLRLDPHGADVARAQTALRTISAGVPIRTTTSTPVVDTRVAEPPPALPQSPYDASGIDSIAVIGIAAAGVVGVGIAAWLLSRRSRANRRRRA